MESLAINDLKNGSYQSSSSNQPSLSSISKGSTSRNSSSKTSLTSSSFMRNFEKLMRTVYLFWGYTLKETSASLSYVFLAMRVLQFLTIIIDPVFFNGNVFLRVLSISRTFSYSMEPDPVFYIIFSYVMVPLSFLLLLMNGISAVKFLRTQIEFPGCKLYGLAGQFTSYVLTIPAIYHLLSAMTNSNSDYALVEVPANDAEIVMMSFCGIMLFSFGLLVAAVHGDFSPFSGNLLARMSGLNEVMLYSFTVFLTIVNAVMKYKTLPFFVSRLVLGLFSLFFSSVCFYTGLTKPFYLKWRVNHFYCGMFTVGVFSSIFLIVYGVTKSETVTIVMIACFIPEFIVGYLTSYFFNRFRFKHLQHKLFTALANCSSPNEDIENNSENETDANKIDVDFITTPFEFFIVCTHLFWDWVALKREDQLKSIKSLKKDSKTVKWRKNIEMNDGLGFEEDFDRLSHLLVWTMQRITNSAFFERMYAMCLLLIPNELALCSVYIQKASVNCTNFFDGVLIEMLRFKRGEIQKRADKGAEEIQNGFFQGDQHFQIAREQLALFGKSLLTFNIPNIEKAIATFGKEMNAADRVYKSLLKRYPSSAKIYANYAVFLRELKCDNEEADFFERYAALLEENKTKKHTGNTAPRHKSKAKFNSVADETDDNDNFSELGYIEASEVIFNEKDIDNEEQNQPQDQTNDQFINQTIVSHTKEVPKGILKKKSFLDEQNENEKNPKQKATLSFGTSFNDDKKRSQMKREKSSLSFNNFFEEYEQKPSFRVSNDNAISDREEPDDNGSIISNSKKEEKLSWYKSHIQKVSFPLFFVIRVLNFCFLALMVSVCVISFVLSSNLSSTIKSNANLMKSLNSLQIELNSVVAAFQNLEVLTHDKNTYSIPNYLEQIKTTNLRNFIVHCTEIEKYSDDDYLIENFIGKPFTIKIYFPNQNSHITDSVTMFSFLTQFSRYAIDFITAWKEKGFNPEPYVLSGKKSDFVTDQFYSDLLNEMVSNSDYRFIVENGYSFNEKVSGIIAGMYDSKVDDIKDRTNSLIVVTVIVLSLVVLLSLGFFGGEVKFLHKNKKLLMRLLLSIKKEHTKKFLEGLGEKKIKDTNSLYGVQLLIHIDQKLKSLSKVHVVRYLCSRVAVVFLFCVGTLIHMIVVVAAENTISSSFILLQKKAEFSSVVPQLFYNVNLAVNANRPQYMSNDIDSVLSHVRRINHEIDILTTSSGFEFENENLTFDLLSRPCSSDIWGGCFGTKGIISTVISKTTTTARFVKAFGSIDSNDNAFQSMKYLYSFGTFKWLNEYFGKLCDTIISKDSFQFTFSVAFLALFILMIILAIIMFNAFTKWFENELKQMVSMFSFFDLKALDSTPYLSTFLSGETVPSVQTVLLNALEDSRNRTTGVLNATPDAIISFGSANTSGIGGNGEGKIDVFNAAAEKMFGYDQLSVKNRTIFDLLPTKTLHLSGMKIIRSSPVVREALQKERRLAREALKKSEKDHEKDKDKEISVEPDESNKNELIAYGFDGNAFPVSVSFSKSDEKTNVVFVRDMRSVNGYQDLIKTNEKLLLKMLPKSIAGRMKRQLLSGNTDIRISDAHKAVSIIFIDIDHFIGHCENKTAQEIADMLNTLVTTFDKTAAQMEVEKIKTIGDIYMAVCGCPVERPDHAVQMVRFAVRILKEIENFNKITHQDIRVRIGINSGNVVAGVIGHSKVMYDLWGSAVNMASRMTSSGINDMIQITDATYSLVKSTFDFVPRGEIEVKGGIKCTTFLYSPLNPKEALKYKY